jgi:hypothetical protein
MGIGPRILLQQNQTEYLQFVCIKKKKKNKSNEFVFSVRVNLRAHLSNEPISNFSSHFLYCLLESTQ